MEAQQLQSGSRRHYRFSSNVQTQQLCAALICCRKYLIKQQRITHRKKFLKVHFTIAWLSALDYVSLHWVLFFPQHGSVADSRATFTCLNVSYSCSQMQAITRMGPWMTNGTIKREGRSVCGSPHLYHTTTMRNCFISHVTRFLWHFLQRFLFHNDDHSICVYLKSLL